MTLPADHAALHAADVAMRDAWKAFSAAYRARTALGLALLAPVGEIRLDDSWGASNLLNVFGARIDALPKGVDLDVAIGHGVIARRERVAAQERREKERADARERIREESAAIVAQMNARLQAVDEDREAALAAVRAVR